MLRKESGDRCFVVGKSMSPELSPALSEPSISKTSISHSDKTPYPFAIT